MERRRTPPKVSRVKKIKIAVVGLGYVGLPLALAFAKRGCSVLGVEIDKHRLRQIRNKESYISDISDQELRRAVTSQRFSVTGDFSSLKGADVVIICVPTPLKRNYSPNISYIKQAVRSISRNLKKGALVVLESTTYPGTTEDVILPLLERRNRKHGKDFYLCFSPERIDPGNRRFPVHKIPKIIGGINKKATRLGVSVYKRVIDRVVPVSSARSAEAVKLLENTFRLINIGLIDELAMMAHRMDMDIWEIIDAAKTKPFGFMPFYPGPGVGGHCIPKDPLYLYWKARHYGFRSRFIKLASGVISKMPEYIVDRIIESAGKSRKRGQLKVLVVGVTYKKDVKDLRKSPALDIIEILRKRKVDVSYYDPIIPYLKFHRTNLRSIEIKRRRALARFDCVVIATDHSNLDYKFILRRSRLVFDTRNVYKGVKSKKLRRL
ncbi:nucleotide sugar dehydrogenase [Candidatus Omnitrophota bacterium]